MREQGTREKIASELSSAPCALVPAREGTSEKIAGEVYSAASALVPSLALREKVAGGPVALRLATGMPAG